MDDEPPAHVEPELSGDGYAIEKFPEFATCGDCECRLRLIVWGEGIDSSIECTNPECDNESIYR